MSIVAKPSVVKVALEEYYKDIEELVDKGFTYSKKDPTGYFIRKALKRVIKDYTAPKEFK
jgi:hypothetical protein